MIVYYGSMWQKCSTLSRSSTSCAAPAPQFYRNGVASHCHYVLLCFAPCHGGGGLKRLAVSLATNPRQRSVLTHGCWLISSRTSREWRAPTSKPTRRCLLCSRLQPPTTTAMPPAPPHPFKPDVADVCQLLNWKNIASKLLKPTLSGENCPSTAQDRFPLLLHSWSPLKLCHTQTLG